jgi:hypothetical protein
MKKPLLLVLITLFFASCATVQQNGYIQSRKYQTKSLFAKKKRKHKQSPNVEITPLSMVKAIPLSPPDDHLPPAEVDVRPDDNQAVQTYSDVESPGFTKPEIHIYETKASQFGRRPAKQILQEFKTDQEPGYPASEDEPIVHWAAIVGMITGILSLIILPVFFGLCGIIFSAIALSAIRNEPDQYKGRGMAVAGLTCGVIAIFLVIVAIAAIM